MASSSPTSSSETPSSPSAERGGSGTPEAPDPCTVREAALRIVTSRSLTDKVTALPADLDDAEPGPLLRLEAPGRPPELRIVSTREDGARRKLKVPQPEGLGDPRQRVRILSALANHELQAAELFAWALLAFPDAPAEYRAGLRTILDDEQRHTRMYVALMETAGARFGDFPVSGYFWNKVEAIRTPLDFVCAMSLTFENANLDHTALYIEQAERWGDAKTRAVVERVRRDEIEHVRFGWTWLQRLKGERSAWRAYCESLAWPLKPSKAKGKEFRVDGRRAAGLDEDFIRRLRAADS
ncbi:MAG: DUF455 family protein [Acidobacteriota bacterium]